MHSPILQPVVALVLWTFVMWAWLYATRIPAVQAARAPMRPETTHEEFNAALPARVVVKRRYRVDHGGRTFGVDVFEGELAGLVLCEAEAGSREAIMALAFPPWAGREVTADRFFTGGNLATTAAAELAARLGT